MSILKEIFEREQKVFDFIKNNTEVSDVVLQNKFCSEDLNKSDLTETIDALIFEEKIKIITPKNSQVPLYVVNED